MCGGGNVGVVCDNSDFDSVVSLSLESRLFIRVQDHLHWLSIVLYIHWRLRPLLQSSVIKTEDVAGLLEWTQHWRLRERNVLAIQSNVAIAHDEGDDNTFPQSVSRKERLTCGILLELLRSCLYVLVVAWARVPYGSYWRPSGSTSQLCQYLPYGHEGKPRLQLICCQFQKKYQVLLETLVIHCYCRSSLYC